MKDNKLKKPMIIIGIIILVVVIIGVIIFAISSKNKKNKKIVDKQLNDEYNNKSHAGVVQW